MTSEKCTEQLRIAMGDGLFSRCAKLANLDQRALSEWARIQLYLVCELHDRGVDLSLVVPRRRLDPSDYE